VGGLSFNAGSISATLDLDRDPFQRGLEAAKAEAKRFEDETFKARLDVTGDQETKQKIDSVEQSGRKLANSNPKVKIDADDAQLTAKIARAEAKVAELERQKANPKIDLDIAKAQLELATLAAKLDEIQAKPYTPKLELDEAKVLLQIATVQERIDALTSKKATINIDADIGAAEAQLAALQASATDAGDAAAGAAPQFSAMATGILAAFPPAAAAVLALTGALEIAAIPMVAIKVGMTGIQAAAAPLAGQFLDLQSIVSATFENGLKPAIETVSSLMPTLRDGLVGTASALSTVATQVGQVASSQPGLLALQASFSNIQSLVTAMAPGLAGFTQNILDLGQLGTGALSGLAGVVNGLAVQWHGLIDSLTSSGVAQVAIQSLVGALGAVAAWIPPVVQAGVQLMAAIGPPLVGALQLVGGALNLLAGPLGGITSAVLAGVVAWKILGPAMAATEGVLTGLGAKFGVVVTAEAAATAATAEYQAALAAQAAAVEAAAAAQTAYDAAIAAGLPATAEATALSEANAAATSAQGRSATAAAAANTANAAAARGAATANATAGAAAAGGAASTGGLAGALGKAAAAFSIVAVGAIVGYTAIKSFTTSTDEAVAAMGKGGQAAADMTAKVKSQTVEVSDSDNWFTKLNATVGNWTNSNILGIATIDSTTEAVKKHRDGLTDLQRAQEDATKSAGDYQQAVDQYGKGSIQATEAQKKLAEAALQVSQAQAAATVSSKNIDAAMLAGSAHFGEAAQAADGAAQAMIAWANALATLADPLASAADKTKAFAADMQNASDSPRNLLEAMNAANKSITSFAESTLKITPAMIDASGAINTATKAGQELATGILGSAKAYDNLYGATLASAQANGDTMPQAFAKAALASEDFRQKLIAQAQQHGATREQAQAMADAYLAIPKEVTTQISQPGMVAALVDSMGLSKTILGFPSTTTVEVKSITDDARKRLEDLGLTVRTLPNGHIIIGAETGQVDAAIAASKLAADTAKAVIKLQADPIQFNNTVHDGVAAAMAENPRIPVGAAPEGFYNAVRDGVAAAQAAQAVMPISGNPGQFTAITLTALAWAGNQVAVATLDGQPEPFNGKVGLAIQLANGSTGTIALDGNPEMVNGKITQAVVFADGSKGTMTLDANPDPATGRINGTVSYGNGQTSRISVDANAAAANAAIDNAARARTATITVTTIYAGSSPAAVREAGAGGGLVGGAGGGLVGAVHMATGGVLGGYAPGVDNIPAVLSPGEAVLVPELVRQLGPGNILAANLAASGRQPTFWNGARPQGGDGVALGPMTVGSSGGNAAASAIAAVVQQLRDDAVETRKSTGELAKRVDALVGEIRRSGTGASIVVNDRSGDPVETARETTLRLRLRR
jgi:hypothetical protein